MPADPTYDDTSRKRLPITEHYEKAMRVLRDRTRIAGTESKAVETYRERRKPLGEFHGR